MRVIAGKWRSRRLLRPATSATRPPPDRLKETVFNILGNHYGTLSDLPTFRVADVFAGSGAFGLEALSRGAAACTFFERERTALAALRQNITSLGAEAFSTIVSLDAWQSASQARPDEPFALFFLDPPYRESEDTMPQGRVCEFLARLCDSPAGTLVVLHHPLTADWTKAMTAPWMVADARHIGSNGVTIFAR